MYENFRIRSTATGLWFATMADADMLDVETTALKVLRTVALARR